MFYNYEELLDTFFIKDNLTTIELSKILNRSVIAINKDRRNGISIPHSRIVDGDTSSGIHYKLIDVANYLQDEPYKVSPVMLGAWRFIFKEYGTALLSIKQTSELTGLPIEVLKLHRKNGIGIPYKKVSKSKNAVIRYSIHDINNYVFRNSKEVI